MRQVWDRVHIEAVVLVNSAHLGDIARYAACSQAGLAQSVERQALNLMVGGSSPPVGVLLTSEWKFGNCYYEVLINQTTFLPFSCHIDMDDM